MYNGSKVNEMERLQYFGLMWFLFNFQMMHLLWLFLLDRNFDSLINMIKTSSNEREHHLVSVLVCECIITCVHNFGALPWACITDMNRTPFILDYYSVCVHSCGCVFSHSAKMLSADTFRQCSVEVKLEGRCPTSNDIAQPGYKLVTCIMGFLAYLNFLFVFFFLPGGLGNWISSCNSFGGKGQEM